VAIPAPTRVISEATARSISRILVGVVERGTGIKAAIPGFSVAGKTGTAQKAGVGGYQAGSHIPNFAGFAPAEKPRLVAVVVLEEPQGKYYAADVAAPLFARVVSQGLGILRVAPREQRIPATVLAQAAPPADAIRYAPGVVPAASRRGNRASFEQPAELTPRAQGLSARQALALFARLGVLARIQGAGFVVAQDPLPGTPIRAGAIHTLFLAENGLAPAAVVGPRMEETAPPPSAP
jgi:cell division protein FtsI (penicillin-binding protein 3)